MTLNVDHLPQNILPNNSNKVTKHPVGSFVNRSVTWLRGDNQSQLKRVIKCIVAIAIAALLALSLVGIPLLVKASREWKLQASIQQTGNPLTGPRQNTPLQETKSDTIETGIGPLPQIKEQVFIDTFSQKLAAQMFHELSETTKKLLENEKVLKDLDQVVQRFGDIPCIAKTAVKTPGFLYPYLHANHVKFNSEDFPKELQTLLKDTTLPPRILTQAPLGLGDHHTLQVTQEQFWKAAVENTNVIVDLTRPTDNISKYFSKEVYTPESDKGQRTFGQVTVTTLQVTKMKYGIEVYRFHVKDAETGNEKEITRIHYPKWKDYKGIAKDSLEQLEYLYALERLIKGQYTEQKPTFTHCRAGVGRAGTYTVISTLIELATKGTLTHENRVQLIKLFVLAGRMQRGEAFVQSENQLHTILELSLNLLNKGTIQFALEYNTPSPSEVKNTAPIEIEITAHDDKKATAEEEAEILLKIKEEIKEPLEVVKRLAIMGMHSKEDVDALKEAIPRINKMIIHSKFDDNEVKDQVYMQLKLIKDSAGQNWSFDYVTAVSFKSPTKKTKDLSESTPKNPISNVKLPKDLKQSINLTLNAILSHVPEYVKKHPAYHPELILKEKPPFEAQKITTAESLRIAEKNGVKTNVSYLYRDSSTHSGPKGIHTFTLTYTQKLEEKEELSTANIRFAYNKNTSSWQLAKISGDKYDLDSSGIIVQKTNKEKFEGLNKSYPDSLTFDENGNILNKFKTLENLTQFYFSAFHDVPPSILFPIRRKSDITI